MSKCRQCEQLAPGEDPFCGNDCEIEFWTSQTRLWKARAIKFRKLFRKTAKLYRDACNSPPGDLPTFVKKEIGDRGPSQYRDLPISIELAIGKLGGM